MAGEDTSVSELTSGQRRSAIEFVDCILASDSPKHRLVAIMIASVDGKATIDGGSMPLGHPADRALLRELRGRADVLLVGSRTLAIEGYANLLDPDAVARRSKRGQSDHPVLATVSRSVPAPSKLPVLRQAGLPMLVFTEHGDTVPAGIEADLELEVAEPGGVTAEFVVDRLVARGAGLIVCEGGPSLLGLLIDGGLVNDLLVTVSPMLIGGEETSLLGAHPLSGSASLELLDVYRADSHLFLHYRSSASV